MIKRLFDLLLATFLLTITLPIFIIVSFILALQGGSIIFRQDRIGKDGKIFTCYKFRSMIDGAETLLPLEVSDSQEWQQFQKIKGDNRRTKLGKILRKTSIDELPQIFNVFKGDMSIVGPRPILPLQIEHYGDQFCYYTAVKPGITGPWQVSGRNKLTFAERVKLECDYGKENSLLQDIIILLKTPFAIFAGE